MRRSTARVCGSRSPTTGSAGPTEAGGSGLSGLRDRVHAVGGELWIESPPGAGTRLRAELPA
jgi:signal transduction histidine kinase